MKRTARVSVFGPLAGALVGVLLCAAACGDEAGEGGQKDATAGERDAGDVRSDSGTAADAQDDVPEDASVDAGETPEDSGNAGPGDAAIDDDGPIEGSLQLTVVPDHAVASNITALVGEYTGDFGIWAPNDGMPERYTDSCTITVAADGKLTVRAGDNELTSSVDGHEYDTVMSPNRDALSRTANAFDVVGNDTHVATVTVIRGYVTSGIATVRTQNNQPINTVHCYVRNPNPRSARPGTGITGTDLSYGGATAADLDEAWFGSYGNGTCSVTIGEDGTIHLTRGAVDMSARLAGDSGSEWGDSLAVFPSSVELNAGELLGDGGKNSVRLTKSGDTWRGFARTAPDVLVEFSDCQDLVKQ